MRFLLIITWLLLLSSCAYKGEEVKTLNDTDLSVYERATQEFNNKRYKKAASFFSRISLEFPYSELAKTSALMEAYSHYLQEGYYDAITALDNYIYLYPADNKVSYAHYLKAMCHYNRINDVYREQETSKKAMNEFEILVSRFPQSDYAKDARLKMELVEDHLAGKQMDIGRTYLFQNQLISAFNRFNQVVKYYDRTIHVQEALYRLSEIYLTWGDIEEAQKTAAVLGHNYPASDWYKKAYELLTSQNHKKLNDKERLKNNAS